VTQKGNVVVSISLIDDNNIEEMTTVDEDPNECMIRMRVLSVEDEAMSAIFSLPLQL